MGSPGAAATVLLLTCALAVGAVKPWAGGGLGASGEAATDAPATAAGAASSPWWRRLQPPGWLRQPAASSSPQPLLLGPLRAEKAAFLQRHGQQYGYKGWLDRHWQEEVGFRFAPEGLRHFLDFTASSLYTRSHLEAATALLQRHTLSNPHSRNPSSATAEEQLLAARRRVLRFLNAPEDEYAVIFTKGATEALKTVGESFPWSSPPGWEAPRQTAPGGFSDDAVGSVTPCGPVHAGADSPVPAASSFVYLRSNHKSVLGMGAYARSRGAMLSCVDEAGMTAWLGSGSGSNMSLASPAGSDRGQTFSLVAFPSKDNYEGRLYPWEWVEQIHAKSTAAHRWLVVVDAAAYAPTHQLDLARVKPDFVPMSFYKIFGYPTGVGALVARKESISLLHKLYYGGGSVIDSTAEDIWRVLMPAPDGFEDGTVSFLSIAQLQYGFDQLDRLGGIKAVEAHVSSLQAWTHEALSRLRHSNGQPLVQVFGRHGDPAHQSCIFQLLVLRPNGSAVSTTELEVVAGSRGIAVRTGCMCNPSQCLHDLGVKPEEHRQAILDHTDLSGGFITVLRPDASGRLVPTQLPIGSVRVSLGYLSTFEDVYALVDFIIWQYRDGGPAAARAGGRQAAAAAEAGGGAVGQQAARPSVH